MRERKNDGHARHYSVATESADWGPLVIVVVVWTYGE
jgi:hypothetical protein